MIHKKIGGKSGQRTAKIVDRADSEDTDKRGRQDASMGRSHWGNELADRKAKETAWIGKRSLKPDIITPAGTQQNFPLFSKFKYKVWDREPI